MVGSGLRWAWVAGALAMAMAGCTPAAKPATASSAAPDPAGQVFAAGCPKLSGVGVQGTRIPGHTSPAEQRTLDRLVPGAQLDYVICQYAKPGIEVDVRAFRGPNGTAQATALADAEQVSTSGSSAGFVTVPASGDNGGFAWSDEDVFGMAAHSGNAYVVVTVNRGGDVGQESDPQKPLRKQVPALTAMLADALDALR